MRRPRAPGLRLIHLCACSPGPQADSNSGFHFSLCRRRGQPDLPLSVGPWVPCSHGNDLQKAYGARTSLQHPCTQVRWPQLADPTSPSPGFKPPPSNTPHFLEESSSSSLPHTCLGLGRLPLTSGTQRSQRKVLQHESPWRACPELPESPSRV